MVFLSLMSSSSTRNPPPVPTASLPASCRSPSSQTCFLLLQTHSSLSPKTEPHTCTQLCLSLAHRVGSPFPSSPGSQARRVLSPRRGSPAPPPAALLCWPIRSSAVLSKVLKSNSVPQVLGPSGLNVLSLALVLYSLLVGFQSFASIRILIFQLLRRAISSHLQAFGPTAGPAS